MTCPHGVLKVAFVFVSVSELVDSRALFEPIHDCTLVLLHSLRIIDVVDASRFVGGVFLLHHEWSGI